MRMSRDVWSVLAVLMTCSAALAGPATTPSGADGPRIAWPTGWTDKKPSKGTTKQLGDNAGLDAGALLAEAPVSDYADGLSIADYATDHIAKIKTASVFKTAKFTVPAQQHVGDHDATVVEADVLIKSVKFHYQITFIKEGDYFCTVYLWAVPSKWKQAASQVDVLIAALH